jgi:hypothetical protein
MSPRGLSPLQGLSAKGLDVLATSHAEAILSKDFAAGVQELVDCLMPFTINIEEIVRSGGGITSFTQRLRTSLHDKGWAKREFVIRKLIDGVETQATSHEVDHVKIFSRGTIALEIEWNNKDPLYDRDLDNFKRLHADGGISVGAIVTRGKSLQAALPDLVLKFARDRRVRTFEDLDQFDLLPTRRQRREIERRMQSVTFEEAWMQQLCADKFGEATTHWNKLESRVTRGAGNPCPLIMIGLPASIVVS